MPPKNSTKAQVKAGDREKEPESRRSVPDPPIVPEMDSTFFFQAEDGIRDYKVTGVQTCALPILTKPLLS